MAGMTVARLFELFENNPEKEALAWPGACHDCGCEVQVTATPQAEGISIEGGSVYEPEAEKLDGHSVELVEGTALTTRSVLSRDRTEGTSNRPRLGAGDYFFVSVLIPSSAN